MNLNYLIRKNIKAMRPYSSARDEFKDLKADMVFLDANENPFETDLNRYPDPQQTALKELISKQKRLAVNQLLLGNGSDEVLDLIFRAFCEPNQDSILTLPPTYGMYSVLAQLNSIENIEVCLTSDFKIDVNQVLKQVTPSTKLLFLCSPNNPSGNVMDVNAVTKLLKGFNGLVIIDEAYIDFTGLESWTQRLNEFPNLIVTQTLSKAYGLAGIRLGTCFSSKEIIAVLNKIKPPYNINTLTQNAAIDALQTNEVFGQVSLIINEREKLSSALESCFFVEKVFLSSANFILIKVDDANKRYNELIKYGFVVRNRTTQSGCENCLRISIGTPEENIQLLTLLNTFK